MSLHTARNALVVFVAAMIAYSLTLQPWFKDQISLIDYKNGKLPPIQVPDPTSDVCSVRPGSQYDARPLCCVASSLRNAKYSNFRNFFMTRCKNARIESKSILALQRASMRRQCDVMQALASYCEPALSASTAVHSVYVLTVLFSNFVSGAWYRHHYGTPDQFLREYCNSQSFW